MKSTRKSVCLAVVLCTGFAAFGSLAQERVVNIHDMEAAHKLLDEWQPAQMGSRSSGSASPAGTIIVRNFETSLPYVDLLKFYTGKCGIASADLASASAFADSGSRGAGSGAAILSVSNRPDTLSSTFVRLYPRYTVTITLNRARQSPQTAVTVTRIDLPEKASP